MARLLCFVLLCGIASMVTTRGQAELEYAKKVSTCTFIPPKQTDLLSLFARKPFQVNTLDKTFFDAMTAFENNSLAVSQRHNLAGATLLEQVARPLQNLFQTLENNRRRIEHEYTQRARTHQQLIKNAERAAQTYRRTIKEFKDITRTLNQAMNSNPQQTDRLFARKQQCIQRIHRDTEAYKQAVDRANAYATEFYGEPIKRLLTTSFELIRTHFDSFKSVLTVYATQFSDAAPVLAEANNAFKAVVEAMDVNADTTQFISTNGNLHQAFILTAELEDVLADDSKVFNDIAPQQPADQPQPAAAETKPVETSAEETPAPAAAPEEQPAEPSKDEQEATSQPEQQPAPAAEPTETDGIEELSN